MCSFLPQYHPSSASINLFNTNTIMTKLPLQSNNFSSLIEEKLIGKNLLDELVLVQKIFLKINLYLDTNRFKCSITT